MQPLLLDLNPLNWIQITKWILEAVTSCLEPVLKLKADVKPSVPSDPSSRIIHAAIKSIQEGNVSKAFKILTGSGLADDSDLSKQAMSALFKKRSEPLQLPVIVGPQLSVSLDDIKKLLYSESRAKDTSLDAFGWSASLLFTRRAALSTIEKPAFHCVLADFIFLITNTKGFDDPRSPPPLVGFMLAAGSAFGAHKLDLLEQLNRSALGLPPVLRPLVAGTKFGRLACEAALQSEPMKKSLEGFKPVQVGLGTPHGPQLFALTAQAAFNLGLPLGQNDIINFFNEIDRQLGLKATAEHCPPATALLSLLYSLDSLALFGSLKIMSESGFRQGCTFGSFGAAATLKKIHSVLQDRFSDSLFFIAGMDDLAPILKAPTTNSHEGWQERYLTYAAFLKVFDDLLGDYGLKTHPKKRALLLPPNCPDPSPEVLSAFPSDFRFTRDGIEASGGFYGHPAWVKKMLFRVVDCIANKFTAVGVLGLSDAQAAFRLMTDVGSQLLSYLAQITPPNILQDVAQHFDKLLLDTVFKLLAPANRLPPSTCSDARIFRAILRLQLPTSLNGCGLQLAGPFISIRWWTTVAKLMASGPSLLRDVLSDGLAPIIPFAYNDIISQVNDVSRHLLVPSLLPANPFDLLNNFYGPGTKRLKRLLSQLVTRRLLTEYTLSLDAGAPPRPELSLSDRITATALPGASIIFKGPLTSPKVRMSSEDFISYLRLSLNLSPLPNGSDARFSASHDHMVEACPSNHPGAAANPSLDAAGSHAFGGCTSACSMRNKMHDDLVDTLSVFSARAGLTCKKEPDTFGLLLEMYPPAQVRKLFPKRLSKSREFAEKWDTMLRALDAQNSAKDPSASVLATAALQKAIDDLPSLDVSDADRKGLRIDLHTVDPVTLIEKHLDIVTVAPQCRSYLAEEIKVADQRLSDTLQVLACSASVPDLKAGKPSSALQTVKDRKLTKYTLLIQMIQKQVADRLRGKSSFVPFAATTLGELSADAEVFMDYIVQCFRLKCRREGPRLDGLSVSHLTHTFAFEFRSAVQATIARGAGKIMAFAGLPHPLR